MVKKGIIVVIPVLLLFLLSGCVSIGENSDWEVLQALGLHELDEYIGETPPPFAIIAAESIENGSVSIRGVGFDITEMDPEDFSHNPFGLDSSDLDSIAFYYITPTSHEVWGAPISLPIDFSILENITLSLFSGFDISEGPEFEDFELENVAALEEVDNIEDLVSALQADFDQAFPPGGSLTFTIGYEGLDGYRLSITSHPKVTLKANPKSGYKFKKWTIKYSDEQFFEEPTINGLELEAAEFSLNSDFELMDELEWMESESKSRTLSITPQAGIYLLDVNITRDSSSSSSDASSSKQLPATGATLPEICLLGGALLAAGTALTLRRKR